MSLFKQNRKLWNRNIVHFEYDGKIWSRNFFTFLCDGHTATRLDIWILGFRPQDVVIELIVMIVGKQKCYQKCAKISEFSLTVLKLSFIISSVQMSEMSIRGGIFVSYSCSHICTCPIYTKKVIVHTLDHYPGLNMYSDVKPY